MSSLPAEQGAFSSQVFLKLPKRLAPSAENVYPPSIRAENVPKSLKYARFYTSPPLIRYL